jgi:PAS domain S-box-containing protein
MIRVILFFKNRTGGYFSKPGKKPDPTGSMTDASMAKDKPLKTKGRMKEKRAGSLTTIEDQLKASEQRYRSLVEDRPGFIVRWQPNGLHLFANRNYCSLFGKSPEAITQCSFTDFIHPEARKAVKDQIARLSPDHPAHSGERRVLLPDGTTGWHHWTDRAIFDDAGRVIEIESTGYDISEQKTSEKAIRNIAEEITGLVGEKFFKSLMNYLADALEADHALIARFSENRTETMSIISAFSRGKFSDGFDCGIKGSPFEKIVADGLVIISTDPAQDLSGSRYMRDWKIHSLAGTMLHDSRNSPIGLLAVMNGKTFKNENLTRNILRLFAFRAAAELEREQSDRALRQSEHLFRMLAENARDMIFRAVLPDGKYEYASPASTAITGYAPEEISGFPTFAEFVQTIIHPAFKQEFQKIWNHIKAGRIRPYYEYKIIHKNGDEKWIHQRSVLVSGKDGQPAAIEGIVTDITERKNLENKIIEMQKMQAVGTLAGGIAHDFNNILGVIIGNAEMMELFDLPAKSPVRTRLSKIVDAGYRAKELIGQILTFASMGEHTKRSFPLKPIIKDSVKFLRSSLPVTIDMDLKMEDPDISISGDPIQIQRVLINLGTNAGQAMVDKKGKITVALRRIRLTDGIGHTPPEAKPGDYALLTVEDTGKGMEQSVMARIFEPYFTTKKYGEGVGLGLAVVHGIVKNHEGFISVDSELGRGTIFKIYLPLSGKTKADPESVKTKKPLKGNERILFVDDEIFIVDVYREILEKYGYTVVGLSDPHEALEIFRSQPDDFDLIISDMTMPHMTGDELIHEIYKIRPEMPVIICTGYNDWLDQHMIDALGVLDAIKKPVGAKQLAETVRNVLDKRERSV